MNRDAAGRTVAALNLRCSAAIGRFARIVARWDGATCARQAGEGGDLWVCTGARGRSFARGGTTYGDTYVTGSSPATTAPERIRHELVHVAQWRRWGLVFPLLYAAAELRAGGDPRRNRFEAEAGLRDGGYA